MGTIIGYAAAGLSLISLAIAFISLGKFGKLKSQIDTLSNDGDNKVTKDYVIKNIKETRQNIEKQLTDALVEETATLVTKDYLKQILESIKPQSTKPHQIDLSGLVTSEQLKEGLESVTSQLRECPEIDLSNLVTSEQLKEALKSVAPQPIEYPEVDLSDLVTEEQMKKTIARAISEHYKTLLTTDKNVTGWLKKEYPTIDKSLDLEEIKKSIQHTKVMLVDDSKTIHVATKKVLEKQGVELELNQAMNGQEAIDKIEAGLMPEVILLDIEMPEVDGFGVADYIRNKSPIPNVPIIMITSKTQEKYLIKGKEYGVFELMNKPFDKELLFRNIDHLKKHA